MKPVTEIYNVLTQKAPQVLTGVTAKDFALHRSDTYIDNGLVLSVKKVFLDIYETDEGLLPISYGKDHCDDGAIEIDVKEYPVYHHPHDIIKFVLKFIFDKTLESVLENYYSQNKNESQERLEELQVVSKIRPLSQLPKAKAYRLARLNLTIGQLTLACPIGSNCKNLNEKGS